DNVIIANLKRPIIKAFISKFKKCQLAGETVWLMEQAIKSLLTFLRSQCDVDNDQRTSLEIVDEYLKSCKTGTSRRILVQRQKKLGVQHRKGKTNLIGEVCAIF